MTTDGTPQATKPKSSRRVWVARSAGLLAALAALASIAGFVFDRWEANPQPPPEQARTLAAWVADVNAVCAEPVPGYSNLSDAWNDTVKPFTQWLASTPGTDPYPPMPEKVVKGFAALDKYYAHVYARVAGLEPAPGEEKVGRWLEATRKMSVAVHDSARLTESGVRNRQELGQLSDAVNRWDAAREEQAPLSRQLGVVCA